MLKPGHSPLDWNRLTLISRDLAGNGGIVRQVLLLPPASSYILFAWLHRTNTYSVLLCSPLFSSVLLCSPLFSSVLLPLAASCCLLPASSCLF